MIRGAELNCFHLGKLLHPDPLPFSMRSSGEDLDELIGWNVHYVLLSYLHLPPVSSIWCLCPVGLASLINRRTLTSILKSHSNSEPQTQDSDDTFLKTKERYRYATSHSSGDNVPAFKIRQEWKSLLYKRPHSIERITYFDLGCHHPRRQVVALDPRILVFSSTRAQIHASSWQKPTLSHTARF